MRGSVMLSYFKYVAGNEKLFSWFNGFGLAALIARRHRLHGTYRAHWQAPALHPQHDAVRHLQSGGARSSRRTPPSPIIASEVLRQFCYGTSGPLIWAMMGDVADYGEWKTGRRATGTVTAAVVFALWVGLALGGAIAGWLFSFYGYVANAVQTQRALDGIRLTAGLYSALFFFATAICLFFYPISRKINKTISDELAGRRLNFRTAGGLIGAEVSCREGGSVLVPVRSTVLTALFVIGFAATAQAPATLKSAYQGDFVIGAAINVAQITGEDARGDAIIQAQFNSISPENCLKWESVHPQPDKYDFTIPDQYVAFGEKNHMFIVGHNLVWHNQVPAWVFRDDKGNLLDRDALLARMHDHIRTVVGRYKGRIQSWDVVNEALNEDGTMRPSLWEKIIGDDYIAKAFQYAHEADPQAQLTYNDYNLENEAKRKGAIALITKLKAEGVPITSVGLQGHDSLTWPTVDQMDAAISDFARLGVKVAISELDIDVLPPATRQQTADVTVSIQQNAALNPYVNGLPDSVQQQLAKRYGELFGVFVKHRDVVTRVTFWGVTDGDSWRNDWPVRGRTSYPLLFDRAGQPKPAFESVIRAAGQPAS